MKSIIVISDTHGYRAGYEQVFPVIAESDIVIHLGDTSRDGMKIKNEFPQKSVYLLNGNCDMPRLGLDELTLEVEGVKIFACHGDAFGVKRGTGNLAQHCAGLGAGIGLFGHTHKALEKNEAGVTLFNPGTTSRYAAQRSYLYLAVYDGKFTGKIVNLQ